jgi:putative DNA methylase
VSEHVKARKKLIEVALPLDSINTACTEEGSPFTPRHPRSLHVWWARRRLAVARAVIFAQMIDDPSSNPDLFPTDESQEKERKRLFRMIEELIKWENTTNEKLLQAAQDEIRHSWHRACRDNTDHPRAEELFNSHKLPAFHDPFAGGGALPLEAQRLGLEAYASDLNPVAVLINKAMIEIPPKFSGRPPINPEVRKDKALFEKTWKGAQGLAEDVRYYGQWVRDEAEKRIGDLYRKVDITADLAKDRPDLMPYVGKKLTVSAWLWARTVKSPNPAFSNVDVPLASTFMLCTKVGKEAYVEPVIENGGYRFTVRIGKPRNADVAKNGTKVTRGANFRCLMSETAIPPDFIYREANAGRMGARLMAVVAEGGRGRLYLPPTPEMEALATQATPEWKPEVTMPDNPRWFSPPLYGLKTYGELFTPRQLVTLTTFCRLVEEVHQNVECDAAASGLANDGRRLRDSGFNGSAYADAVVVYLALAISRWTDLFCSLSAWNSTNQNIKNLFSRHAIPMVWDFAESNPFGSGASFGSIIETIYKLFVSLPAGPAGYGLQLDAAAESISPQKVISTDPPYYDNIGYADLSDFFYVWLRKMLSTVLPELFQTVAVPKSEELVATPYRHGSKEKAEAFFLAGMTRAMHRLAEEAHHGFPITIFYAFKQSESEGQSGVASTGWETFLAAVIRAGLAITGTWPIRTERTEALKKHINALASSIVLVCRPRSVNAPIATRREFIGALKTELPVAVALLQHSNVAPVDLAQSALGPGMAVYTRYAKVVDAEGKVVAVRDALGLINQTLDEAMAEQEGDFDADTRWALTWFDEVGFAEGSFGKAEQLSKSKNTSVGGMVDANIITSKGGKVRLLRPAELSSDWDPIRDPRLTVWEVVHHLVRRLESGGEAAAAELVSVLGGVAEVARELAYRLYTICERKKRAQEALSYNALVQSWPEIIRLGRESRTPEPAQEQMFQ